MMAKFSMNIPVDQSAVFTTLSGELRLHYDEDKDEIVAMSMPGSLLSLLPRASNSFSIRLSETHPLSRDAAVPK